MGLVGIDKKAGPLDHDRGKSGGRIRRRAVTILLALGWVLVAGYTMGVVLWGVRFLLGPTWPSGREFGLGFALAALAWFVMLRRSRRAA